MGLMLEIIIHLWWFPLACMAWAFVVLFFNQLGWLRFIVVGSVLLALGKNKDPKWRDYMQSIVPDKPFN